MLSVRVSKKALHPRGAIFTFTKRSQSVRVLILTHARDRMAKWKLTLEMVGETLLAPEEVLIGHHDRFIAHRRYGHHVLRAVYEYDDSIPTVVTVYFPHKERYFEGGGRFEDKIFK